MREKPQFSGRLRKNIVKVPFYSPASNLSGADQGGGITTGVRSVDLAIDAESRGALSVVLNKPVPNDLTRQLQEKIDISILVPIVSANDDIKGRIEADVDFLNV